MSIRRLFDFMYSTCLLNEFYRHIIQMLFANTLLVTIFLSRSFWHIPPLPVLYLSLAYRSHMENLCSGILPCQKQSNFRQLQLENWISPNVIRYHLLWISMMRDGNVKSMYDNHLEKSNLRNVFGIHTSGKHDGLFWRSKDTVYLSILLNAHTNLIGFVFGYLLWLLCMVFASSANKKM